MLKRLVYLSAIVVLLFSLSACGKKETIKEYNKDPDLSVGEIEKEYDEVIEPGVDMVNYIVKKGTKYGIASKEGKCLLECEYDKITEITGYRSSYISGYIVKKGDKYGFLEGDNLGKLLWPIEYEEIIPVDIMKYPSIIFKKDNKYGVIYYNKDELITIPPEYDAITLPDIDYTYHTEFLELKKDNKIGLLDFETSDILFEGYGNFGSDYQEVSKEDICQYHNSKEIENDYSEYITDLPNPFYSLNYIGVSRISVDLDGDGRKEKIDVRNAPNSSYSANVLYINGKKQDIAYVGVVGLVDFDKNDKYIEVLVSAPPDSESFFRYDSGEFKEIGGLSGTSFDGFGNVIYSTDYAIVHSTPTILSSYHKLEGGKFEKKKVKYPTLEYMANEPMIFSENYDGIKKCIDCVNFMNDEFKYFLEYRENAEILEEGTKFVVVDVIGNYTDAIPLVKLSDGRQGYIMNYDAHEEYIRRL